MAQIRLNTGAVLDSGERPLIMAILNATPDSFYADSRIDPSGIVARTRAILEAGADIIDIGGESSRPGSQYVDAAEEIGRVMPIIKAVRSIADIPLSIDTRKSEVARRALEAGATMINDISALRDDPEMAPLAAEWGVPIVLMHMQGSPATMQIAPTYSDTVGEIVAELERCAEIAMSRGVGRGQIIIDPGIGFGKSVADNLRILAHLERFRESGFPVLIGISRKSFLGKLLVSDEAPPKPVEERLAATVAAQTIAALRGADILRVHDVAEAVDLARIVAADRAYSTGARQ